MTTRSVSLQAIRSLVARIDPLPGRKTVGAFVAGVCFGVLGSLVVALALKLDLSGDPPAPPLHLDGLPSAGPPPLP